jgi:hypothetical protein
LRLRGCRARVRTMWTGASHKRLTVQDDTFENLLAEELANMRRSYEAKLSEAKGTIERLSQQGNVLVKLTLTLTFD